MAAAATLPKTIFITTLPTSVSNTNYVQCQAGLLPARIGTKRSFSIVSSSPLTVVKSPSPPAANNTNSMASNWLPATVQRTYKFEASEDDDYGYGDDSEDQNYDEPGQPPRKRERLTHLTAEEKMFRRKMKNRIAAQTARDRKKALMVDLEETVRRLEEENDTLLAENSKLRHEQSSLADENERLKKMLSEKQKQQQEEQPTRGRDDARTVSAFGPAEGASEGRMGIDLASRIRTDPALLEILRQIVAVGGAAKADLPIGGIEGERQLDAGGSDQSQPAGGNPQIMGHNSIVQEFANEATVIDDGASYVVQSVSANNDHQYFNSAMSSSSILFSSSSNANLDLESFMQPQATNVDLFSTNDTADVQQFLEQSVSPLAVDPVASLATGLNPVNSPNGIVPTSPTLNLETDFPPLGDDILEQALQTLGELNKVADTAFSSMGAHSSNADGFDFLQNDDYADLAWEESFAQLFPSLSNA